MPRTRHPIFSPTALAISTLLIGPAASAQTPETRSTLADQTEVAVTIYNSDLALVRDQRKLTLTRGANTVAFREISALIRPETALLRSVSHPKSLQLLEQNFDYDLLSPNKLLEKYVGKDVGIIRTHPTTGAEITETARVLSVNQGVVLQYPDRIEMQAPGRVVFSEVPPNLRDKPTLVMQLNNEHDASQTVELSYLTSGLNWNADYVAELNKNDDMLDLAGWVTLSNQSGATYKNTKLQLVAGDVNRVYDNAKLMRRSKEAFAMAESDSAGMQQESLFEYHLYTLGRLTTIAENQTKQVALLSANAVPATKEFRLVGADYYYRSNYGAIGQKLKVGVFVKLTNDEKSNLGMPLPKGTVRVYKKDAAGNAQFVGEDQINHTPKNETFELKLGDAFDVTADKNQTDFRKQAAVGKFSYAADLSFEILIKNAKSEAVRVSVLEPIPGDWKMLRETHPHKKAAANTARWEIDVPPLGRTTLRYDVQVRF